MAISHLTWQLRFRNGILIMPANNAGKRCPCGDMLRVMRGADHALTCPNAGSLRTPLHDYVLEQGMVRCGALRWAGVASAVEPKLRVADAARRTLPRERP